MAGNIKDVLVTNDPFSYYANGVTDAINERTIIASTDVLATKTSRGTKFNIHPKFKLNPNYLSYVGDWNISGSYDVNDVVSVLDNTLGDNVNKTPSELLDDQFNIFFKNGYTEKKEVIGTDDGQTYIDYTGQYYYPDTSPKAGQFVNLTVAVLKKVLDSPGTYVCVSPVPSLKYENDLFAYDVLGIGFISEENTTLLPYIRLSGVNYEPIHPSLPNIAVLDAEDVVTGKAKAKGCYWRYLGSFSSTGDGCTCRYS